ncbi:MAG: WYL domain-containing protein, partial [Oscillospiraceae bacterium]
MGKSSSQKLKILYILKILYEKTNETHTLTVPEIITELETMGITAERKSIYDDLETLENFGVDIVCERSKTHNYYIGSRTFELAELKLLADSVASSKFITAKKSNQLIKKIETLTNTYEAGQIKRQVLIENRVKTSNEKIYYNVDTLHKAISDGKQISFDYFDIGTDKKKHFRPDSHIASPYFLSWNNENYYLISFYEKRNSIVHFRVDRMENIKILSNKIVPLPKEFSVGKYNKKTFSMFAGKEETVTLMFDTSIVGSAYDRFGIDVNLFDVTENNFKIRCDIAVSQTFF